MKRFLVLVLLLVGCGKANQGDTADPAIKTEQPAKATPYTKLVNTEADLPICNADNASQLVYVKDKAAFKVCSETLWTDVAIKGADGAAGAAGKDGVAGSNGTNGAAGASGISIALTKTIAAIAADICTTNNTLTCFFRGGQKIKFSDNSYFIGGSFVYDNQGTSFGFMVPSTAATQAWLLNEEVDRGSGPQSLYIVYRRSDDTLFLSLDNQSPAGWDATDGVVSALTVN